MADLAPKRPLRKSLWVEFDTQTMRLTGKHVHAFEVNEPNWVKVSNISIGIMLLNGTKKFSNYACLGQTNELVEVPEDIDLSFLSYISTSAWPELSCIDFKWTPIPWLPLDMPRVEPDDWDLFWKLWNDKVGPVGNLNIGKDGKIQSPTFWHGLGIWKNPNVDPTKFNYPHQEFENWEEHFPKMFETIRTCLPWLSLEKVLLWQNVSEIQPHFDPDFQLWPWPESVRIMLWDTNDRPTFYMSKWPKRTPDKELPLITERSAGRGYGFRTELLDPGTKMYVDLPPETNSFVFNNGAFVHGADLAKPKIIMVVKGRPKIYEWLRFLEKSYNKYKHLIPDCRLPIKKDKNDIT